MRASAIVPVKRFAAAKQRLSDALGPEVRAALAAAMLDDVLDAIARTGAIERVIVVTGEPVGGRIARAHGAEVLADPDDRSHSRAASLGVRRALEGGAAAAALLPGDCPLLDPGELDGALDRVTHGRVGVVPDRHGTGTNALLLAPPDAIAAAFGEGSRARHERIARGAGHEVAVERLASLELDVDTPSDLNALRDVLDDAPERAPHTAAALREQVGT